MPREPDRIALLIFHEALAMADKLNSAASDILCSENYNLCFDDPGCEQHSNRSSGNRSELSLELLRQSEDNVRLMLERERDHSSRDDYLERLRNSDFDMNIRGEALGWILKAHAILNLEPQTLCLSVNYLDRFLSVHELHKCRAWAVQLLAVACLSIAAKMEETVAVRSIDLQVGDLKALFDGKVIKRMELLVLATLGWRMHTSTPLSFLDYFLSKISDDSRSLISRSIQLVLSIIKEMDLLEFKASEIGGAVAIFVCKSMDIEKAAMACSSIHVEKGKLLKCLELINGLVNGMGFGLGLGSSVSVPQSPVGVLDASGSLSYKSDNNYGLECGNKRRKI